MKNENIITTHIPLKKVKPNLLMQNKSRLKWDPGKSHHREADIVLSYVYKKITLITSKKNITLMICFTRSTEVEI